VPVQPSGGAENQTIITCNYYKVCRERPSCQSDSGWWDYWTGADEDGCKYHIEKECEQKVKARKRICNAT